MKKLLSIILISVLCLSLFACNRNSIETNVKATIIDNKGNTVELSFDEFLKINKENEAKFETLYKGASITVEDAVEKIDTGLLSTYSIHLESGWKVEVLQSTYDLSDVNKGDKIRVTSKINSIFLSIVTISDYEGLPFTQDQEDHTVIEFID